MTIQIAQRREKRLMTALIQRGHEYEPRFSDITFAVLWPIY